MRVVVQHSCTLTISDPIGFCADFDGRLMTELRNQREGFCFGGVFVTRILSVDRTSECNLVRTNTSGEGYVDVMYSAEAEVFGAGDILVGVQIRNLLQAAIGVYAPPPAEGHRPISAIISLTPTKVTEALALNQVIAARITHVTYPPTQSSFTAVAQPLTCARAAPVYRLRGSLHETKEFAPMLAEIDAELAMRAALDESKQVMLWRFEALLYSYASGAEPAAISVGGWTGPAPLRTTAGESRDVVELVRRVIAGETVRVDGLWSRSLELRRSSPLAACATELPAGWEAPVDTPPSVAFGLFLGEIRGFLHATREYVRMFDSKLFDAHRPVWAAMAAAQR